MSLNDILSIIVIVLIGVTVLGGLYYFQTPKHERYFLISVIEATGIFGGTVLGSIYVNEGGFSGLLLRLGVIALIATPFLVLAAYLKRRRNRSTSRT